jgi:hypothetical protein
MAEWADFVFLQTLAILEGVPQPQKMAKKVAKYEIKVYATTHSQGMRNLLDTRNKAQYKAKKVALTK